MKWQERWETADRLWIGYCILGMCLGEVCQSIYLIYSYIYIYMYILYILYSIEYLE